MLDDAERDSDGLTDHEQQLLDLVRDGKVDAEIAVRLGISNAEVKERIERLMQREGASNRAELRDGPAHGPNVPGGPVDMESASRARAALPFGAVLAVAGLALAGGALAGWWWRGDTSQPPAMASAASPTVEIPTPWPTYPVWTPTPSLIRGREMHYLGRPFSSFGNQLATVAEDRESLLIVRLDRSAALQLEDFEYTTRYVGGGIASVAMSVLRDGNNVLLVMTAADGTEFLQTDLDSVGIFSRREGEAPAVAMYARAPEGEVYYHLDMDLAGSLYISTEPVPADAPVTFDTGELLDITRMQRIGGAGRDNHWTYCATDIWDDYADHPCTALVRGADFAPLAGGNLSCADGDQKEVRFEGTFGVLQLRAEAGHGFPCGPPVGIAPSQPLGYPGLWSLVAFAPDGSPLSVVVTHDGAVYVGEVTPKFGCPCRSGT